MTTVSRDNITNQVAFYKDGDRRFDFTIKGNIVEFSDGEMILI